MRIIYDNIHAKSFDWSDSKDVDQKNCTLHPCSKFCMLFLSPADFFLKANFFKKSLQEYFQSIKQFGSISGPTVFDLDQIVCKGYKQTTKLTKVTTSGEKSYGPFS